MRIVVDDTGKGWPGSGPSHGPVYRLSAGAVPPEVAVLPAAALGLGEDLRIVVRDEPGWPWSFLAPVGAGPRATAQAVLDRLGIGPIAVTALPGADPRVIVADPVVGGLRTSSFATVLGFGPGGDVVRAQGWLGRPSAGPSHPLVDARAAIGRLIVADPEPDGPAEDVLITSARPGLVLRHDEAGAALLVPAWLYGGQDRALPLTAVALLVERVPAGT